MNDTNTLIRAGIAAARAQENDKARQYFVQATTQSPENANAWYYRAITEENKSRQVRMLQQVLTLDPTHTKAQRALKNLGATPPDPEPARSLAPAPPEDVVNTHGDGPNASSRDDIIIESATPRALTPQFSRAAPELRTDDEVTRLLGAQILLDKNFRQTVKAIFSDATSFAPEFNLDVKTLLGISYSLDQSERRNQMVTVGLQIAFLVALVVSLAIPYGVVLSILGVGGLTFFVLLHRNRSRLRGDIQLFGKDTFSIEKVRQKFRVQDTRLEERLPHPDQNFIAYSGYKPFVGAGVPAGAWQIPVALITQDKKEPLYRAPFDEADVYAAIEAHLAKIDLVGLQIRDYVYAPGQQIRNRADLFDRVKDTPRQVLPAQVVKKYNAGQSEVARYYKWISVSSWGGEVVTSFFLRFALSGNALFVEFSKYVLPPVSPAYQEILAVETYSTGQIALETLKETAMTLLKSFLLVFTIPFAIFGFINGLFSREPKAEVNKDVVKFNSMADNRGTDVSLREYVAGNRFQNFFQEMDSNMHSRIIEREIKVAIADFLAEYNVDSSEFVQRMQTIINGNVVSIGDNNDFRNSFNNSTGTEEDTASEGGAAEAGPGIGERIGRALDGLGDHLKN